MDILIVDDSQDMVQIIKSSVQAYIEQSTNANIHEAVIKTFNDPHDAARDMQSKKSRICIFDMDFMADIDGVDLADMVMSLYPGSTYVIYSTAYDSYMDRAINSGTRPIAYIVKGDGFTDNIKNALSKIDKILNETGQIKIGSRSYRVDDILYIKKDKGSNYVDIACMSGDYRERTSISSIEIVQPLYKANKSSILNLTHVKIFDYDCKLYIKDVCLVNCSRSFCKKINKAINKL